MTDHGLSTVSPHFYGTTGLSSDEHHTQASQRSGRYHQHASSQIRLAGWGIVPLLMTVSFICYVNRVSIATAGDTRIMAQYEISPTRMGSVYSAFLLTYTLCMIPGGLFIDRVGPRAALLTVVLGSSVFVALTGVIGLAISGGATAFLCF